MSLKQKTSWGGDGFILWIKKKKKSIISQNLILLLPVYKAMYLLSVKQHAVGCMEREKANLEESVFRCNTCSEAHLSLKISIFLSVK